MTISSLPDDILLQLLEAAVYTYPRTAVNLALVCKPIHRWYGLLFVLLTHAD